MLAFNTLAIGAASFFAVVAANHGQISRAHHHNPLLERSEAHLQKRFNGQATYYAVGLGACGRHNSPGDAIVALNSAQYGGGYPGPQCFKPITICAKGKCHGATIVDECPTCDYGSLDLSQSLFEYFADTSDGVFQMTWTFGGGDNEPEPTTKKPDPPKPTEKPDPPKSTKEPEPEPEPTTTSKPRPSPTSKKHTTTTQPETTSTPEPTTTSSTPTSTSTSSVPETTSTSQAKSTMTTSTVVPTPSPPAGPGSGPAPGPGSGSSGSNWADMAQIMLAMGRLATTAHGN